VPLKSETTAPQIHLNKICRGTNAALLLGDLYVWLYLQSLPKVLILKPDLSLLPLVKLPTKQIARGDREETLIGKEMQKQSGTRQEAWKNIFTADNMCADVTVVFIIWYLQKPATISYRWADRGSEKS
jgi:hypothetical protein